MQRDEFIGAVAERGGLDEEEARRTVSAAMLMFGHALPTDVADATASQLPRRHGDHLKAAGMVESEDDPDALITKMAEVTETDGETAKQRAAVVLDVMRDALDEGARTELLRHLPPAVTDLLPAR